MADRADQFDRSDFDGRPVAKPVKAVLSDDNEPYDYIVQPGDTLERIAAKWLGAGSEWPRLVDANRSRIKDPNLIQPGLKLIIPPPREPATAAHNPVRGYEGAAGFGPIDNVEVEVGFGRAKDRDADPDAKIHAVGAAVKWVPLQSETGLSAGLKYEYGRERVSGEDSSRVDALAGLAT